MSTSESNFEATPMSTSELNYKIVLVGESGSGKTTFMRRHCTGEFTKEYSPTPGVEVHSLLFHTNHGAIRFSIWDTSGNEKLGGGLGEGYYVGSDAAIIFFDLTQPKTLERVKSYHKNIVKICGDIPVVVCGNKVDLQRKVPHDEISSLRKKKSPYYDVSAKSNYNFEKPFLFLAKRLTESDDLVFTDIPN